MHSTPHPTLHESNPALLRGGLLLWAILSATFAASGLMASLPEIAVPVMIWGLALTSAGALWRSATLRQTLWDTDLGWIFALHAVRAPVGVAFLLLGQQGLLDPTFVAIAGIGDIIAGLGALIASVVWSMRTRWPAAVWAAVIWNVFALADILLVFVTAQRVLFWGGGLDAMQGFLQFPMPMIPTFLVPLILITHVWIFVRVRSFLVQTDPCESSR